MYQGNVAFRIRGLYDDGGDPSFRAVLDAARPEQERALAETIETDGRLRLALGREVTLSRYLEAAELENKPVALDAAIEMALRASSRRGAPGRGDVEAMIANYPWLERPIREAVMLAQALRSTTSIHRWMRNEEPQRRLPCALGPNLADGRPRYELLELVGAGATGAVYRAVDRHLSDAGVQATVAIKIFQPPEDELFAQWMREEALKARRVTHENVVRALDRGETPEGESYIVYEFIDGGDLGEQIRRSTLPMPARQAAGLMAEIARGVQAIHSAGLVHCDLKPGNIAMAEGHRPKVADFGIAMREGQTPKIELSDSGGPLGNLAFISPEQFRGDAGAYSFPSDIYALGAILAYLVTGKLPNGATQEEIRQRHEAPCPVELPATLDRDLRRIVAHATAAEPSQRYPSASQFAEDLQRWLQRRPLTSGRTRPSRRALLFTRRHPMLTAVAAVAMVAVGVAGWVKIREQMRRSEAIAVVQEAMQHYAAADVAGASLPMLTLWERFSEATYFGNVPLAVHDHQVEVLRRLVESPEIAASPDSADALIARSALALALVSREQDYLDAEPMARECRRRWEDLFGSDEDWVLRMALVEAAAAAERLLAHQAQGKPCTQAEVDAVHKALEDAAAKLPGRDLAGPLPKLAKGQLEKLGRLFAGR